MRKSIGYIGKRLFHLLWNPHSAGKFIVKQRLINEYQILVFVNEDVGCRVYCYGDFEKDETALIGHLIREKDICMDIGANIGYYTLLMASKAKKGKVHAFEPILRNYHLMCSSILMNGFENVVPNCCAIGNVDGSLDFSVADDSAYSSFVDTGWKSIVKRVKVPVKTLDTYCAEHFIDKVDIIKVDVEGAEKLVLEGAQNILRDTKRKPRIIMLELYEPIQQRYSSTIDGVLNVLKLFSYFPFIYTNGIITSFEKKHYNKFSNIFFVEDPKSLK